jgi:hypothetical protein
LAAAVLGSAIASSASETVPCRAAGPDPEPVETPAAAPCATNTRLGLVWSDPLGALPVSPEQIAREVERIFCSLGVQIDWKSIGTVDAAADEIVIVFLDREPPGNVASRAMGVTSRKEKNGARALWVMLPNLRRTLGLDPKPGRGYAGFPEGLLARAAARVVAHEVLHVLAPNLPHGPKGLMSASLGRGQLVGESLGLDAGSQGALREALGTQWAPAQVARADASGLVQACLRGSEARLDGADDTGGRP